MKKQFLLLCAMLFVCTFFVQASEIKVSSLKPGTDWAIFKQKLKNESVLNFQQLSEYDKLDVCRAKAEGEVNQTSLSGQAREDALKECRNEFYSGIRAILTSDQLAKFNVIVEKEEADRIAIREFKAQSRKAYNAKMENNEESPKKTRAQTIARLKSELTMVVGPEKADRAAAQALVDAMASNSNIRDLGLTFAQKRNYAVLNEKKVADIASVNNSQAGSGMKAEQRTIINNRFDQDVRQLFGEEKYRQWKRNQDEELSRKANSNWKISPSQLKKYQEIENERAVALAQLRQSEGSKEMKTIMRTAINNEADTKLRALFSTEQYNKIMLDRTRKANNKKYNDSKLTQTNK